MCTSGRIVDHAVYADGRQRLIWENEKCYAVNLNTGPLRLCTVYGVDGEENGCASNRDGEAAGEGDDKDDAD